MKTKLLLTVAAITLASNVYAFRILDEKFVATPGHDAHIEEITSNFSSSMQEAEKKMLAGKTRTEVSSATTYVNENTYVNGYHYFNVYNGTNFVQQYEMSVQLDCESLHEYYVRHVELKPGESYTQNFRTYGVVQKSQPGRYQIEGKTALAGETSDSSSDRNWLYVTRP